MRHLPMKQPTGRAILAADLGITPETITYTGKPELENIKGLFWYDEDTGNEDDRLLIFDFEWKNGVPEQAIFEELMKNAGSALDNWISERL